VTAEQAETVTVVEVLEPRTHVVSLVWAEFTITCGCWCGWSGSITDPDAFDCVGQRRQFRAAEQLAASHQYPDLSPAQAGDALADELWARLQDWPVVSR